MKKIYTHNGKAHADELYAIAIIKATHDGPFEVLRVDRIADSEPDDFIVDIGMEYDGKRKFDHHQFNVNMVKHSATTLVADAFAKQLLFHKEWGELLNRVAAMDIGGPAALDIDLEAAKPFIKLEWGLVSFFEAEPNKATDMLADMFRSEIAHIDSFHKEVLKAKEWLEKYSDVRGVKTVRVLELTRDPMEDGLSDSAVQAAQGPILERDEIAAVYSWDSRDPERQLRRLYRTGYGEDKLDFRKAHWSNQVFCHNTGFLMTFKPEHSREWLDIIKHSIVGGGHD